ncbi:MAG TPA: TonB-dependent receptor, partial [Novosphingobium sp.]|nr:TonB-dependent receptor [Novosphingobium sp.]
DDHDTTANQPALTKQRIRGVSLTGEFDLGFASLTSISAYRKTSTDSDFDVDGGPLPLIRIQFLSGLESYQQELRLASDSDGPLGWQIGAFYLKTKAFNTSFFSGAAFGANRGQDVKAKLDSDSIAVFGELTYELTPTTKLTGGIRYTEDKRDFDASQFIINAAGTALPGGAVTVPSGKPLAAPGVQKSKLKYNEVTWRLALRQELTPDVSVYASANKGFKSGSFSLQNPLNDPYLPQTIMAYEAGIKSELFDRRLRLNLAAFNYKIDDYQVRSAAVGTPGSSLILNAATVKVDGVELEFEAAPVEGLRLFGGVTWLNSRYGRFGGPGQAIQAPIVYPVVAAGQNLANSCAAPSAGLTNPYTGPTGTWIGGYVTCLGDVTGNKVSNAPKWAASLGATYTVPVGETGQVRFTGLWAYNDGYFFEPDNLASQGSYSLFNASVEYRPSENWGIELPQPRQPGLCRPEDHHRHRHDPDQRRPAHLWCEHQLPVLISVTGPLAGGKPGIPASRPFSCHPFHRPKAALGRDMANPSSSCHNSMSISWVEINRSRPRWILQVSTWQPCCPSSPWALPPSWSMARSAWPSG